MKEFQNFTLAISDSALLVMSNIEKNSGPVEKVAISIDKPGQCPNEVHLLLSIVELLEGRHTSICLEQMRYLYFFKYYN